MGQHHTADTNRNAELSLSELLRGVQFFNIGSFRCAVAPDGSEDGYVASLDGDTDCVPHDSDYAPQDWAIDLAELLRLIQLYNSGGYFNCPEAASEDGYCPVSLLGVVEGEGGTEEVIVPNVIGLSQSVAEHMLSDAGLVVGEVSSEYSDEQIAGNIAAQSPGGVTAAPAGSAIDLVVSDGTEATANFAALPSSGPAPLRATFLYGSPDKAANVQTWQWDFDNDGNVDSTAPEPTHTYDEPGTYSVRLRVITQSGQTFEAVREDYVSVRDPDLTQVQDNVIVLDDVADLALADISGEQLTLSWTGSGEHPVEVGDIIVIRTADAGYAKRVLSLDTAGETIAATTDDAALEDIFESADITGQIEFRPEDFQKAGLKLRNDGMASISFDGVSLGLGASNDYSVTFNGSSLAFDPSLDLDIDIDFGSVAHMRAVLMSQVDLTLNTQVEYSEAVDVSASKKLIEIPGPSFWIYPGYAPVHVSLSLEVGIGVELAADGAARMEIGASTSALAELGAIYDQGDWRDVRSFDLEVQRIGPIFDFEAGGGGKIFVDILGKVKLYTQAGPTIGFSPYVGLHASVSPSPATLEAAAGYDVSLGFDLVDLEAFGYKFDVGYSRSIMGPL